MLDEMLQEGLTDEASLLRETRSLKRQLRNLQSLLQRNKAMLAARTNVSALLAAEQETMEKNLNLLLDNSPDIILLFDKDGRFTYCTKAFLTATGIANFGLIGGRYFADVFRQYVPSHSFDGLERSYQRAMQRHKTVVIDDLLDFSGRGEPRNYSVHITPMLDENETAEGAMMLFHDSTDIMRAKETAEEANNAKSEFLATMSHEMRTPMNAIIGMTQIAKNASVPEQKEQALSKIEMASVHLLRVINDILDMSKIESGRLELSESPFELAKVLSGAENTVVYIMEQKRQKFIMNVDPAIPPRLVGDEQRLWQVLTNLLSNAIKFTPEEGQITLDVRLNDRDEERCQLRVDVRDTGIGISKEQQKKLFRSFVQADSSVSRRFGGTGLGLVISKSIVEMMGGEIGVKSEENRGATFFFTIWAKEARGDEKSGGALEPGDGGENYTDIFAGRRVLMAEDIEINREIVITLLEPTGVLIDTAQNGFEACHAFEKNKGCYDLVLMDIHMPGMDGYEATRRIRTSALPQGQTVPIIAMTANVFKDDIERCLSVGMNDHLGKPISMDDVIRKMSKYLLK